METVKTQLTASLSKMKTDFQKIRDEKETEEWNKIDEIKERNLKELYEATKQGIDSKSELTLTNNRYSQTVDKKKKKDQQIKHLKTQLEEENKHTSLQKAEIENAKNEIEERKKTIADKDHRIYELNKKTQELEKFKFVLDYKIKELKRDIGPREVEITKLNEQTEKMRQEVTHFNDVNQNLLLIVEDLKLRQEGLQKEVRTQRDELEKQQQYIKRFKDDVLNCINQIQVPKKLKELAIWLHKKYVKEEIKADQGDTDQEQEFTNKRKHLFRYLEKSVGNTREVIAKNSKQYKDTNNKLMKENVMLLNE